MSLYEVRQLPAPAGSASEPSVAFLGDTNTGIYRPGADQVAISTGGTGRLFVDAGGNVGLNVTPFAYAANCSNLHLNATAYSALTFGTTDGGTGEKYWRWIARTVSPAKALVLQTLDDTGSNEVSAYTVVRNGTAIDYQAWNTGGSERLRIDSTGKLGIGTASPQNKLHVLDATTTPALIESSNTSSVVLFKDSGTGGNYPFVGSNGSALVLRGGNVSSENARIDSSGRLLVGTSSDSGGALLQVNGDRIRVGTAKTPASATATGTTGEICWDANYIYVCTATNTWKRTAIASW